jgi:hypothetical protein
MASPPTTQPVWYVRKNGWVQGPFTESLVRQMYATAWIGAVDRVAPDPGGPWRELRTHATLTDEAGSEAAPRHAISGWEIASTTFRGTGPVEVGMLQMFAATGRLRPTDHVRRLPDGEWQTARSVDGVFGGRRAWCTACNMALGGNRRKCDSCGAIQPDFEPSLALVALVCGVLAAAWVLVAFVVVTVLATRRATILGAAMDQSFPQAYILTLVAPTWLAVMAAWLGQRSLDAVRTGRSAPADAGQASVARVLGWATLGCLLLIGVGVTAFSFPYFRVVP